MRRPAVLALCLALLAGACGSNTPTPTPSPTVTPTPSPTSSPGDGGETAWQRALEAVDEDGSFTKEQALTLFATAFGPLPGVDVQQDLTGIHDRTAAISAVMRFRDELTEEQRAAIDAAIKPPADATIIEIPPVDAVGSVRLAAAALPTTDAIRTMVTDYRRQIARHLGFDIRGGVMVAIATTNQPDDDGLAQAWNYDLATGAPCEITVFTDAFALPSADVRSVFAHELVHCFQFHGYGSAVASSPAPRWVIEGQAEWGGALLTNPPSTSWNPWMRYLLGPDKALTQRDYDAIGFYAHLAESGVDPWSTFKAMWGARASSVDAFRASGADTRRFLQSWASSVARQPGRGRLWDTTGPSIIPNKYPPTRTSIGDGTVVPIGRSAFTNEVVQLGLDVDLVHIEYSGDARLNDGTMDTTDLKDVTFCVAGHDCKTPCPDGTRPPPTSGTIRSGALLATTGGIAGATGYVSGENRDCKPPSGKALGDVHMVGIDGHTYDFQAVGEFVLARSADRSLEAQVRLQPYGSSRHISIATALAARVSGQRVVVTQQDGRVRFAVEGEDRTSAQPLDLGGGGRIVPDDDGLHVDLPGGGSIRVVDLGPYGVNVIVEPAPGALDGLVGLVGPTPDGSDLPRLPDGAVVPSVFSRAEYFVNTYRTFADAWRITPAESLFDYEPGTSTETFTDRTFPLERELRLIDDLTAEERAAGEAACGDVPDEVLRSMCVYDVGVTSDTAFSDGYERTAPLLDPGGPAAAGELVRVVNTYANESGPVALDVYAWVSTGLDGSEALATKVATVPYGAAGDFFDPGIVANGTGAPSNWISVQRAGEPLSDHAFNLVDLDRESEPGAVRTLVVMDGDAADFSIVGGRPARTEELYEVRSPDRYPLIAAPADKALVFGNIDPLYYDRPDSRIYFAAGSGCLTQPDFPTVPQLLAGVAGAMPLAVEPGDRAITIHDAATGPDPAPGCTTPSAVPPVPFTAAAGGRSHLFVYVTPGDPTLRTLVVPFRP